MVDSAKGRWLSPDPLGGDVTNPQSLNRYAYVLNNPASFTDPLGLKCVTLDDGNVGDDGVLPPCSMVTGDSPQNVNVQTTWCQMIDPNCPLPLLPSAQNSLVAPPDLQPDSRSPGGGPALVVNDPEAFKKFQTKFKKVQQCVNDFYKSKSGKAVSFFSPLSLVPGWNPDWKSNLVEWAGTIIGKGGGASSTITTGETIITLNETREIASPLERSAGKILDVGDTLALPILGTAALTDVFAHQACEASQFPGAAGPTTVAF